MKFIDVFYCCVYTAIVSGTPPKREQCQFVLEDEQSSIVITPDHQTKHFALFCKPKLHLFFWKIIWLNSNNIFISSFTE